MEGLISHLEYVKMLVGLTIFSVLITLIVYFIFKKNKLVKYLPGFVFLIIGLYHSYHILIKSSIDDFKRLFIATAGIVTGIIGLSMGLIIGIFTKERQ